MIGLLIGTVCTVALLQPTKNRLEVAMLYALSLAAQDSLFGDAPGEIYFFTDAAANFIVLAAVCLYSKPGKFTDSMVALMVASILVNCYGYVAYELYLPPTVYAAAFHAIYLIAIMVMLSNENCRYRIFWLPDNQIDYCGGLLYREEGP